MQNEPTSAQQRGEVLVAIVPSLLDLNDARERHWYRIPVDSVEKWLKRRWPPDFLALYQPKVFGTEAFSVRYYAKVESTSIVRRRDLFPDQPLNAKASRRYYKLQLATLESLPRPILSRRRRRIVFIQTTLEKFWDAVEINDLYDESPLEDRLWAAMKRLGIQAERQEFVTARGNEYALDFAIYCDKGKLDVETDGDEWHIGVEQADADNRRNNDLAAKGWTTIRFTPRQLNEELETYCVGTVRDSIKDLGGMKIPDQIMPQMIDPDVGEGIYQPSLLDHKNASQELDLDEDQIWKDSVGD